MVSKNIVIQWLYYYLLVCSKTHFKLFCLHDYKR